MSRTESCTPQSGGHQLVWLPFLGLQAHHGFMLTFSLLVRCSLLLLHCAGPFIIGNDEVELLARLTLDALSQESPSAIHMLYIVCMRYIHPALPVTSPTQTALSALLVDLSPGQCTASIQNDLVVCDGCFILISTVLADKTTRTIFGQGQH